MSGKLNPECACVACDGSCQQFEDMMQKKYDLYDPEPPCPECGGSGLVELGLDLDPVMGDMYAVTAFCQCDTGEQMRVDYETEQQEREEEAHE